MGQVPRTETFLIVGRGRLARHLARYFALEGLTFKTFNRDEPTDALTAALGTSTHVLLAISDAAIEPFCQTYRDQLIGHQLVHFSGSLVSPFAAGAHPLMTFAHDLYSLETYRSIAFITEGEGQFDRLLPGLTNPSFAIDPELKPLYHAWCVMSGNFSTLLWEGFFKQLEDNFAIPRAAAFPYLNRLTQNLLTSTAASSVLTGPLTRGDHATLEKNLGSLQSARSPYASVYTAFVDSFRRDLQ